MLMKIQDLLSVSTGIAKQKKTRQFTGYNSSEELNLQLL
jgi:hypothetical protein